MHTDLKTGYSSGWAFCKFFDLQSSELAKQILNGVNYNGRRLAVEWAANKNIRNERVTITNSPKLNVVENDRLMIHREIANYNLNDLISLLKHIEDIPNTQINNHPNIFHSIQKCKDTVQLLQDSHSFE